MQDFNQEEYRGVVMIPPEEAYRSDYLRTPHETAPRFNFTDKQIDLADNPIKGSKWNQNLILFFCAGAFLVYLCKK